MYTGKSLDTVRHDPDVLRGFNDSRSEKKKRTFRDEPLRDEPVRALKMGPPGIPNTPRKSAHAEKVRYIYSTLDSMLSSVQTEQRDRDHCLLTNVGQMYRLAISIHTPE